jgi:hypothetical protein
MDWIGLIDDTFQWLAVITTARIIPFLWRHWSCWPDEILLLSQEELRCLDLLTSEIICELGDECNNEFEARSQNCEKQLRASSYLSVSLSIRMVQLGSHWTDFHETWHLRIARKSVKKIQVSLKSDKNDVSFTRRPLHIYDSTSLNSS